MHAGLADTDGVDDVPIVVLTGLEDDHLALEAIQQGAQDYLVKGNLDADTLDRAIRYGLERHRQERRLRRQAEQLEDLATAVSHDIRTPLDTAMGHLRIVAEEHDHESLDRVEHALTRIDDLTDDLLALVREGRAVEETAAVDLAEVARSAWHTVPAGDATLEVRADATVRADRKRLYRVFENLFANAVEHGSSRAPADALAGGATDVTVRVGTTETGFYVADDGPGLDTDAVERVFDAGYTTAEGGAGYGLTIVANAVEAHGWDVRAGRSETGGARFDVGGVTFVAPSGEG
jgi:signal transduction histidine kinase